MPDHDRVVTLRRATAEDCWDVYEWRQHPDTRMHFFDPRPISRAAHAEWFGRVLVDPKCHLLVAHDGATRGPVGVLRLDERGADAEVDVYVVPGLAGKGWGSAMLSAAASWASSQLPVRRLIARVLPANVASRRAFINAGFGLDHEVYAIEVTP